MMQGVALRFQTELITEECCNCHMLFAMPKDFRGRLLGEKRGTNFYCPQGHPQRYTGESKEKRLQRMLDEANRRNTQLAGEVRRAENSKKRLLRRVHAGVCPHCNRTFSQLSKHIKTKHPEVG